MYGNKEKVLPILDRFRPVALRRLCLNENSQKHFLAIVSDREDEYIRRYSQVKDGAGMVTFYGRAVAHITRTFDPNVDLLQLPQMADAVLAGVLCRYATDAMIAIRSLVATIATRN